MAGSKKKKKKRSWMANRQAGARATEAVDAGVVVAVSDKTFRDRVLRSPLPVVVTFVTPDSAICRGIEPALTELAGQYSGLARLARVNADRSPKTVRRYDVHSLPTTLAFKDGELMQTIIGATSKGELSKLLAWMLRE